MEGPGIGPGLLDFQSNAQAPATPTFHICLNNFFYDSPGHIVGILRGYCCISKDWVHPVKLFKHFN